MVTGPEFGVSGVYKIVCRKNGKAYIGSSMRCLRSRWLSHFSKLRAKSHRCSEMQKDFDLYGEDEFEFAVIARVSPELCRKAEQDAIASHDAVNSDSGYNQKGAVFTPKKHNTISKSGEARPGNAGVYLRIPPELLKAVSIDAKNSGRSVQSLLLQAACQWWGVEFREPKAGFQHETP